MVCQGYRQGCALMYIKIILLVITVTFYLIVIYSNINRQYWTENRILRVGGKSEFTFLKIVLNFFFLEAKNAEEIYSLRALCEVSVFVISYRHQRLLIVKRTTENTRALQKAAKRSRSYIARRNCFNVENRASLTSLQENSLNKHVIHNLRSTIQYMERTRDQKFK